MTTTQSTEATPLLLGKDKNPPVVIIDGGSGEGGGQIVRSSLGLCLITGRPLVLNNIRSRRAKRGLRAQHVACVRAAADVGGAEVHGGGLNESSLSFYPQRLESGRYSTEIGTAGAAPLVVQTVAVPLAMADRESVVTVSGGTAVPFGPTARYLEKHWAQVMQRIGIRIQIAQVRAGYMPEGGGELWARILPSKGWSGIDCTDRGRLKEIEVWVQYALLPDHVGFRQAARVQERLKTLGVAIVVSVEECIAPTPGTDILIVARYDNFQAAFSGLGKRGKPSERVADEACDKILDFHASNGCVDSYTADQILMPLALAKGPSRYSVNRITGHLLTNARVISAFLNRRIEITGETGQPGTVSISDDSLL